MRTHGFILILLPLLVLVVSCSPPKEVNPPGTTEAGGSEELDRLTAGGVKPASDDTLLRSYQQGPDTINPITSSDNVSRLPFKCRCTKALAEADYERSG